MTDATDLLNWPADLPLDLAALFDSMDLKGKKAFLLAAIDRCERTHGYGGLSQTEIDLLELTKLVLGGGR